MERIALFLSAVVSGLAAPLNALAAPLEHRRPPASDLDRMRGDWVRVGETMRHVIEAESRPAASQEAHCS